MRSKIILILAALVLSSMIFACSPISSLAAPIGVGRQDGQVSQVSYPSLTSEDNFQNHPEPVASQIYWGSSQSDKFHYPSRRWAQRIKKSVS